ncbi:MAG: hypothetical protein ACYTE8_01040 [Planctomycetota bacterium]
MDCTRCPDFSSCTSLCAEASKYVSQDHVGQGKSGVILQPRRMGSVDENTSGNTWLELMQTRNDHIDYPTARIDMSDFEKLSELNFSKKQLLAILRYFVWGDSASSIARDEGVSRQAIFNRLQSSVDVLDNAIFRLEKWDEIEPNLYKLSGGSWHYHRMVLFLYLYERLERNVIAERLGLSFQYVCKLLNVALEKVDENVD